MKNKLIYILIGIILLMGLFIYFIKGNGDIENKILDNKLKASKKKTNALIITNNILQEKINLLNIDICVLNKDIEDIFNSKNNIINDFEKYKKQFKKLSRKQKDLELLLELKKHNIIATINSDKDIMFINSINRDSLLLFSKDYIKLFNLSLETTKEVDTLTEINNKQKDVILYKDFEIVNLNQIITICNDDKTLLQAERNRLQKKIKREKLKKWFYSIGSIALGGLVYSLLAK